MYFRTKAANDRILQLRFPGVHKIRIGFTCITREELADSNSVSKWSYPGMPNAAARASRPDHAIDDAFVPHNRQLRQISLILLVYMLTAVIM